MKKSIVFLFLILVIILIASCVYGHVNYCPYCGKGNVEELSKDVYKCISCGKEFGVKEINEPEEPIEPEE